MINRVNSIKFSEYTHENGGRVLLLFLLFLLAIYEFVTAGFSTFAIICILPLIVLAIYIAFRWKMSCFWMLITINYFIQMKDISIPIPLSLPNEMLQLILLAIAVIDARQNPHFERAANMMLLALMIWCGFCTLELLNDTCNLGIDAALWYNGARLMAFQILFIFLVFIIYISSPEILIKYLKIWAIFSLFSVYWTWKQQNLGFTAAENSWLQTRGRSTHLLNAGTLIRYFSTFSDAANYGCNAAASAVAFIIIAITSKIKREKIFYAIVSVAVIWGMFQSGTRTAIFCLGAGLLLYVFLSKSIKIAVPFSIAFAFFAFILIFTNIGNGNQQIRRMRSAFKKDDASANVRDLNKQAIAKYIKDAPWGIGLGMGYNVPANNKYAKLATIPPDSEYVYIWIRTGPIGITIFVITTIIMFIGACQVVLFRLKNKSLIGVGGGLCGAFVAIQLGGYANQVLMQIPNCLIFYGGLAIVYVLPYIEPEWNKYEDKRFAEQEERKRLKLEKKLASRV
ncbi:MAG: O-antigen ligase family protein [Prevotella sp.]|nr:O-antigen ligase family protein [Prevotella sp.]